MDQVAFKRVPLKYNRILKFIESNKNVVRFEALCRTLQSPIISLHIMILTLNCMHVYGEKISILNSGLYLPLQKT